MMDVYIYAVEIAGRTMLSNNNCFSVVDESGIEYKILNFYYENLPRWESGLIKLLFKCRVLRPGIAPMNSYFRDCRISKTGFAVIEDDQINRQLYNDRICETCAPPDLKNIQVQ